MSLYAVQDNVGNYWDFNNRGFHSPRNNPRRNTTFNLALADAIVQMNGGHVVELAEAPAKVVVSEAEAEMLKLANAVGTVSPTRIIMDFVASKGTPHSWALEDRLMRAYVNGYTVEKEKKYLVYKELGGKQDKENDSEIAQAYRSSAHPGTMFWVLTNETRYDTNAKLTEKEISDFDLQDCKKEEVTDDEQ